MQLMLIIAGEEYAEDISSVLIQHGYRATEIGSNGEFLQYGETVLLLGLEDGQTDTVVDLLKRECNCPGDLNTPFREQVKLYVMSIHGYHRLHVEKAENK